MRVKWKGLLSQPRELIGGGPQGSTFGIWEYLCQSNENAACVPPDYRYKFVDDLTILEKIDLLSIGLASFNYRSSVPSHIPTHGQLIPNEKLKTQEYLDYIKAWTDNQKMMLNKIKTTAMIFNFNHDYQFTTNLQIDENKLELVEEKKLLGVIVSNDLTWEKNTRYIIKRANSRLELLRKMSEFSNSIEDKRLIYIMYVRSILEQSCIVWHSSLTQQEIEDLERVQRSALKLILGSKYKSYEEGLVMANLQSLEKRREQLCKKFAQNCIESENERINKIFEFKTKQHKMKTRCEEKIKVKHANTERLKKSGVVYMQNLLNIEDNSKYQLMKRMPGS